VCPLSVLLLDYVLRVAVGLRCSLLLLAILTKPLDLIWTASAQLNALFRDEHLDFLSELRLVVGSRINSLHILRIQVGPLASHAQNPVVHLALCFAQADGVESDFAEEAQG
jgi:hypothetical protein